MNLVPGAAQPDYGPRIHMDPALQLTHEALHEIMDIWRDLAAARPMPARAEIEPRSFLRHLPDIALVDLQTVPLRMRYRLVGSNIARAVGRELTGRWYDTLYPPTIMAEAERVYSWILTHRKPLRTAGMALFFDRRMYSYECLNLPLSSDGETVDMVLVAMKFYLADAPVAPGA